MSSAKNRRFGRFLARAVRSFKLSLMSPSANMHDLRPNTGDKPSFMAENGAIVFDNRSYGAP